MRDQTSLVREACKWDYELKFADQIVELLDRGAAIAQSTPTGPVYLSLPREVLSDDISEVTASSEPCMVPSKSAARHQDIETLARWITEAENPVIFSQRGTGSQKGFELLTKLVEEWALPVNTYWAQSPAIPTRHPMHVGSDPNSWVRESDLIIVIDALAPWMPDHHKPRTDAKIVQISSDPLYTRTPVRNFHSNLSIPGEVDETIESLMRELLKHQNSNRDELEERRVRIEIQSSKFVESQSERAVLGNTGSMSKNWVSKCLSDAIASFGRKATVTSELGCPLGPMKIDHFNGYRQEPHSGGLGYGLPAAMGIQLAEPETLVFATVGDGSYMFANPTACHQVCEALGLPVITCVLNNGEWGAVRHSVQGMYPDGYAAKANKVPLTSLQPSPDFTKVAEASRAYVERVETGEDLPGALKRAVKVATQEKRQVLLDIAINGDPT